MPTCTICGGTGKFEGEMCTNCMHTGVIPITSKAALGRKMFIDKLDAIIAEQASQREDLEAALLQIWNKVKDL